MIFATPRIEHAGRAALVCLLLWLGAVPAQASGTAYAVGSPKIAGCTGGPGRVLALM